MKKNKILIQLLVFLLSIFLLYFTGLNNHGLWTPDEPRVAEIGREMAERGNFYIPELNRRPFLEQPPLYYASLGLIFKIAGYASEGLARIPSAIYGLAGALATFLIANTLFGMRTGIISVFIISTAFEYLRVSHWVIVDSALACFIFFAMWFFIKAYLGNEMNKKTLFYMLFYVFCTLAFLVKGLVGIAVPAMAVITFFIVHKNIKEITRMHLWAGLLLFFLSIFLWAICLYTYGGVEFLKIFFIENNLLRFFSGGTSGHHRPFYYYFTEFPSGFMPWSIFIIPSFLYVFSKDSAHDKKGIIFLVCWFISGFVLFSCASTKRILYTLPLFAPISIIIAVFIDHVTESLRIKVIYRVFLWLYGILYLITGALFLPAVLYLKRLPGISTDKINLFYAAFFSVVVLILAVCAMIMLKKEKIKQFFFLSWGALSLFLLFALIYIAPEIDRYKSLKPFAVKVMEYVPAHETIYSYKPDETIRGFIPFYTGRYIIEIHDRDGLKSLKQKDKTIYMVIRDKDDELKRDLIDEGFTEVINYTMGTDRALCLLKK